MPVIDTNYILIPGSGTLLWQAYTDVVADQFTKMRTFGGTGGVKITTNRETLDYEEGNPSSPAVRDVIKETGSVEILLIEKTLEDLVVELGYGTVTEEAAQTDVTATHTLWLRSTGWQLIPQVRYGSDTALTVSSVDTTPVVYSAVTDYKTGNVEGCLAIARLSTGTIDDNEEVSVAVTYDVASRKYITMGGANTIQYVHLMHVKTLRDGVRREITQMYKASIAGEVVEDYPKGAHAERTVTFGLIADSTRSAGDRLWKKYQENLT